MYIFNTSTNNTVNEFSYITLLNATAIRKNGISNCKIDVVFLGVFLFAGTSQWLLYATYIFVDKIEQSKQCVLIYFEFIENEKLSASELSRTKK